EMHVAGRHDAAAVGVALVALVLLVVAAAMAGSVAIDLGLRGAGGRLWDFAVDDLALLGELGEARRDRPFAGVLVGEDAPRCGAGVAVAELLLRGGGAVRRTGPEGDARVVRFPEALEREPEIEPDRAEQRRVLRERLGLLQVFERAGGLA